VVFFYQGALQGAPRLLYRRRGDHPPPLPPAQIVGMCSPPASKALCKQPTSPCWVSVIALVPMNLSENPLAQCL